MECKNKLRFKEWSKFFKNQSLHDENVPSFEEYIKLTETSKFAQKGELSRDVVRTFPGHSFFRENTGEIMLTRVLTAFTLARSEIGYCQGMNFVAAILILGRLPSLETGGFQLQQLQAFGPNPTVTQQSLNLTPLSRNQYQLQNPSPSPSSSQKLVEPKYDPSSDECRRAEYDVFKFLLNLVYKGGKLAMQSLWQAGQSQIKLRAYQLDNILKWLVPKLHQHFFEIQLTPEVLVAQWFVTLYSYTVPISLTMRIWDYIFCEGWPSIFQVALAILKIFEEPMLLRDVEGISGMMKSWRITEVAPIPLSYDDIIDRAQLMPITEDVLIKLQESFALEMISLSELTIQPKEPVPTPIPILQYFSLNSPPTTPGGRLGGLPKTETWLARYGDSMTAEVATDMLRVRDDLKLLESQIETDRMYIQDKILEACETCMKAQNRLDNAKEEHTNCLLTIVELNEDSHATLLNADLISQAVNMDTEESKERISLIKALNKQGNKSIVEGSCDDDESGEDDSDDDDKDDFFQLTTSLRLLSSKTSNIENMKKNSNEIRHLTSKELEYYKDLSNLIRAHKEQIRSASQSPQTTARDAQNSPLFSSQTRSVDSVEISRQNRETACLNGESCEIISRDLSNDSATVSHGQAIIDREGISCSTDQASITKITKNTGIKSHVSSRIGVNHFFLRSSSESQSSVDSENYDNQASIPRRSFWRIRDDESVQGDSPRNCHSDYTGNSQKHDSTSPLFQVVALFSPATTKQPNQVSSLYNVSANQYLDVTATISSHQTSEANSYASNSSEPHISPIQSALSSPLPQPENHKPDTPSICCPPTSNESTHVLLSKVSSEQIVQNPLVYTSSSANGTPTSTSNHGTSTPNISNKSFFGRLSSMIKFRTDSSVKSEKSGESIELTDEQQYELERTRRIKERMENLSSQSQSLQQRLIFLQHSLEGMQVRLAAAKEELYTAFALEEEAQERKTMLCEQLQRLLDDAARCGNINQQLTCN